MSGNPTKKEPAFWMPIAPETVNKDYYFSKFRDDWGPVLELRLPRHQEGLELWRD